VDEPRFRHQDDRIKFKGILDERTQATVHLTNGKSLEKVRFLGFTASGSIKGPFPFELQYMVIFEQPDGGRILVPAKLIEMVEVPPNFA